MKSLPRNVVLPGDAREVLAGLLVESVDCVITSPPYYRLRDYGVRGQLGQETTVDEYVATLRAVMREVRRVLKPTGSLWLNLGDTYSRHVQAGAPPKSLLLAPERVARALLDDSWLLRSKVIWHKPNPLPSSVADRLSPTYEVLYFFTKSRRYFFDLNAIREPHRSAKREGRSQTYESSRRYQGGNGGLGALKAAGRVGHPNGKNPGDVWTFPTAIDRLGHQATFPARLLERPIRATCPERICEQCDRAWTRPVRLLTVHTAEGSRPVRRVGELQRCDCFAPSRPGVVLDPFFGTGTVGEAAAGLGRDFLGVELSPVYRELAARRLGLAGRRAA